MFAARPRPGPASGFFAPGRMSWPRGGRRAARCGSAAGDGGAVGLVESRGRCGFSYAVFGFVAFGSRSPASRGTGARRRRFEPMLAGDAAPVWPRVRQGTSRVEAPGSGTQSLVWCSCAVRSGRWRLERWPCGPPAVARAGLAVRRFRLAHRTLGPPGGGRAPTPPNPAGTTCPLPDDCSSSLLKRNFLRSHRWCGFCGKPSCSQLSGVWTGG